ncbi:MAG: ABC transporter ATP-binding protein [Planctomycetota bacterium]
MLIQFNRVYKIYGESDAEVRALDGVDLSVREGDFAAVMGPSGSGKSTCMNILGCLDAPTSGLYAFRGVDVGSLTRNERALLRRNYLGFVFQGFNLLKRTSAVENVELPLVYNGTARSLRRKKAMHALELVGLIGREHHTPAELSGGQQQRVAIARALVTNPSVLLADEPTGNLDSARSEEIMELLVDLNDRQGITILMVTHEPEMADYAKRCIKFRDGRIQSDETALEKVACSGTF